MLHFLLFIHFCDNIYEGDFMTIGIICEYNPFHNGHLYHLNKIKEMYKDSTIILVLSGSLTQRGDISIINKFDKAKIALYYGVDIVVELNYTYSCEASDIFAKGAISILKELKVDKLIFGSEANNIDKLKKLVEIQINNKEYDDLVKKYIDKVSYPKALSMAIEEISGDIINTPNDILGLSYVREIMLQKANIEPISIKRTNDFNSKTTSGKISSATSIRQKLIKGKRIKKYIPKYAHKFLKTPLFLEDYFDYIKFKIISEENLTKYQTVDIKLSNKLKNNINNCNSLEELILTVKDKNYTYNRVKRGVCHILFSLTKEDCKNKDLKYIRLLGFSKKGQNYLNSIKKDLNVPIISKFNKDLLFIENRINNILALNKNIRNKKEFIEREYKEKIVKID